MLGYFLFFILIVWIIILFLEKYRLKNVTPFTFSLCVDQLTGKNKKTREVKRMSGGNCQEENVPEKFQRSIDVYWC